LTEFSERHFSVKDHWKIQKKTGDILDILGPLFEKMYLESLSLHPTEEIKKELQFLQSLSQIWRLDKPKENIEKNPSTSEDDIAEIFSKDFIQKTWNEYEFILQLGTILNDDYLHTDAVATLNQAIDLDPSRVEGYLERAHAFFELDNVDLAVKDYKKIRRLQKKEKSLPKCALDSHTT
jgi:tetratricopeptide (TPR) repeat protein